MFHRFTTAFWLLGVVVPGLVAAAQEVRQAGQYAVMLRLPASGLNAGEEQQIEFRVTDTSRVDPVQGPTPVIRARIQGVIDMPAMPGMPKVSEVAHPEGVAGEYGMHPVFAHGGEFRLKLAVEPPGDAAFTVEFPLQVADASSARKPGPLPYAVDFAANPKSPKAEQPVEFTIRVNRVPTPLDKPGATKPGPVTSFEKVHDAPMHLIVVRTDLGVFRHEHPQLGSDGVFRLKMAFPTGGEYRLFADVAPRGAGSQVLSGTIKVNGKAERFSLAAADRSAKTSIQGTTITLDNVTFPARRTSTVNAHLTSATGPVRDLEPFFGAMGHFILVHADGVTFVHSHPDERDSAGLNEGKLPFLVRLPKPGLYRGWIQFQRGKTVLTAAFVLEAKE